MRIAVAFVMITCAFAPLATGRADAPGTSPSRADARADVRARWLAIVDEYERWRDTVWPEEALASGRPCPVPDRIADRSYRGIGLRFTEESEFVPAKENWISWIKYFVLLTIPAEELPQYLGDLDTMRISDVSPKDR
jgi:hypothetical protein